MSRHQQISDQLRHRVLTGELTPGTVLPTTQEMAAQYKTSTFTVQTALIPLVEEGLLERKRRVGTIVRHNPSILTCAAIYCGSGLLDEREFAFARELCRQLQLQLAQQNIQTVLHADMRDKHDQEMALPALRDAVHSNQVQALFVGLCDEHALGWLRELPIASSFVTATAIPNRVDTDYAQLFRLALGRLREQGCQSVGLISSIRIPTDTQHDFFRFYDHFVAVVSETGMNTRDPWVVTPAESVVQHEAYGYAAFRRLWQQESHPDGLLVFPDTSARGSLTAMLELGVRVPADLRVVFHRNTGINWPCPLPIDSVVSDVALWAETMIKQVQHQKAGKAGSEEVLPYRLQFHTPNL